MSVTICLALEKWDGESRSEVPIAITGPPEARYRDLVDEVVYNGEGGYPFIDYDDVEHGQRFTLFVDRTATMAEVAEALGEEIHAQPPTLMLGSGGRGGDGGFTLEALLYVADDLKRVGEWVGVGLVAWKLAVARYYRTTRRLAKDWVDTDEISMELRQAVLAYNPWDRTDFDRVFKLADRGPVLLRALGFERDMQYGEPLV